MDYNKLITPKLILRYFSTQDTKNSFENWGTDKATGKFFPFLPTTSVTDMEQIIKLYSENKYIWAIIEKFSGNIIGNVSINIQYEALKTGELAYLLSSKWWGKGYAYEAVIAVLQYMFVKKELHLIEAKYNENNINSAKLLNKLGFKYDGTLRDRRIDKYTGERNALIICSIMKEEFIKLLTYSNLLN